MKIGISLPCLRRPLRKAIVLAGQLGASAVEIDARGEMRPSEMTGTAVRQLRKMLEDYGLQVCSVRFLTRRGYDEHDALDRRVAATKEALRMAYQLRAPVVVNRIGRVPDDSPADASEQMLEALHDIAQHGTRVGATLVARTGSEEGSSLARFLSQLPEGGIGVDFDPAALIINSYSPLDALQALAPFIRQVRARDGVRDLAQGRGVETPLGRGTADFPALLASLEDHAYRGYFTIDREFSEDPVSDVRNAVEFLRNVY